jgi:hypothetical protein
VSGSRTGASIRCSRKKAKIPEPSRSTAAITRRIRVRFDKGRYLTRESYRDCQPGGKGKRELIKKTVLRSVSGLRPGSTIRSSRFSLAGCRLPLSVLLNWRSVRRSVAG